MKSNNQIPQDRSNMASSLGVGGPAASRRVFICRSLKIAFGMVLFNPLKGQAIPLNKSTTLSFYHTHTCDSLKIHYVRGGVDGHILQNINYFLRDHRTGDIHPIDIKLIEFLSHIKNASSSKGVFEVISGYRSPKTNQQLRVNGSGVAKKSLHMMGKAIDIRLTDVKTKTLRDVAWSLQKGGVGYYRKSNFVHIDIGRIRRW